MRDPNLKNFEDTAQPVGRVEEDRRSEEAEAQPVATPSLISRAALSIVLPAGRDEAATSDGDQLMPHELVAAIEASVNGHARRSGLAQRMAMLCAGFYGTLYDFQMRRRGVRLVRQRVGLMGMPKTAPTLRIGFISDLHYGPTSGRVAARQAWKQLHDAKPDLLLLGGDFLYADHRGLPALLRELQRWKWDWPSGGIYAVLGDGDYLSDTESLSMAIEACGVRILRNQAIALPEPWDGIWLAGIDDHYEGESDIGAALGQVPRGALTLMLSHSPQVCAHDELKRCALTLCGHTLGGQICLPNSEPIRMKGQWAGQYPWGLHRHAGNWVYVSRGVGTVAIPLRLFAPPDVALFEVVGNGGGNVR